MKRPHVPLGKDLTVCSLSRSPKAFQKNRADAVTTGSLSAGILEGILPPDWFIFRGPLHSTGVKDFQKCARYSFFKNTLGLHRKGSYAGALRVGEVFHQAMEHLVLGLSQEKILKMAALEFESWFRNFKDQEVGPSGVMPDGSSLESFEEKCLVDFWKAIALAFGFWNKYPLDTEKWEVLSTEQQVLLKLQGVGRPISTKPDLIVRNKKNGEVWAWDYKTTSSKDLILETQAYCFDVQPYLLRFGLAVLYPEEKITGITHCLARKPTIKYCPKTKDKEGPSSYISRVEKWIDDEEKGQPHSVFLRSNIRFPKKPIPYDLLKALAEAGRALKRAIDPDKHPRCASFYTCTNPFGTRKPCPYLELCRRESFDTWGPLFSGESGIYRQEHRDFPSDEVVDA